MKIGQVFIKSSGHTGPDRLVYDYNGRLLPEVAPSNKIFFGFPFWRTETLAFDTFCNDNR